MTSPASSPPDTVRVRAAADRAAVPGAFDHHAQASPVKDHDASDLPPLPPDDSSLMAPPTDDDLSRSGEESPAINEKEMGRRLMDVESSFLPAHSPLIHESSLDHAALAGYVPGAMGPPPPPAAVDPRLRLLAGSTTAELPPDQPSVQPPRGRQSPPTPPETYHTPAPPHDQTPAEDSSLEAHEIDVRSNTSLLETMSSSPTAAAAARTISRVVSMASVAGYETADDQSPEREPVEDDEDTVAIRDAPPSTEAADVDRAPATSDDTAQAQTSDGSSLRPQRTRFGPNRSSISSLTSASTGSKDGASDVTIAADAGPANGHRAGPDQLSGPPHLELSRSTSLGSIASAMTGYDPSSLGRTVSGASIASAALDDRAMPRLAEESSPDPDDPAPAGPSFDPTTPRPSGRTVTAPTDTVIAQHVRDVQVPASVAREYRQNNRPSSPEKRAAMPTPMTGRGKTLTLKEQSSSIDRLQKENFDLKLKIHYLNQALNERSEEGVKEMISENVELKASLAAMEKQARSLRKTIRDLERARQEREQAAPADGADRPGPADAAAAPEPEPELVQELEEEIGFLRERIEEYELEIEKMRQDEMAREVEKRRLGEMVKSVGERRGLDSDIGAREETDMWKDLLEAETARREQADQDNRKLRDEIWRLTNDAASAATSAAAAAAAAAATTTTNNHHTRNVYLVNKRAGAGRSRAGEPAASDRQGAASAASAASSTLIEQLRHENEELRREVGAQTSMLTSRNREKERLYQEIEDLKLGHIRADGGRSVAGDSILERSASRAADRAAAATPTTGLSDAERDEYERQQGQLRDQLAGLRLTNQELERQLEACLDDLDRADLVKAELERSAAGYGDEVRLLTQDLQTMQAERDEALSLREELEAEFDGLKAEAQHEMAALEAELDRRGDRLGRAEAELAHGRENFEALQQEMRGLSEGLVRLEDEQQAKARATQSLRHELDAAGAEIDGLETALREAQAKIERFTVQQESSQGEIAFLREEQDGDKIKIGDLAAAVKKADEAAQDERDRVAELEARLVDERRQRELVGGQEKQEVQRTVNELQREASAAKDEARRLRKALSARDIEATEWKERLTELENNLREALGDVGGTRSSLLTAATKLAKEVEEKTAELEAVRQALAETERVLRHRDQLLENTGLESRRLSDLLERERLARKAERSQLEGLQRTTQHTSRTLSQHEGRVKELESGRASDGRKLAALEQQMAEQLLERHNLLLSLWHRLSSLCGNDWAHKHTLVHGRLPTVEVVATLLPAFRANLLAALATVEGVVAGFRSRVHGVEQELWKRYQALEHELEVRAKKLDRLEAVVHSRRTSSAGASSSELAKLRGECRLLRAELKILRRGESPSRPPPPAPPPGSVPVREVSRGVVSSSMRHHRSLLPTASGGGGAGAGAGAVSSAAAATAEALDRLPSAGSGSSGRTAAAATAAGPGDEAGHDDASFNNRLREMERRLRAEREARLEDRAGARQRLEEGLAKTEELRQELERERMKNQQQAAT